MPQPSLHRSRGAHAPTGRAVRPHPRLWRAPAALMLAAFAAACADPASPWDQDAVNPPAKGAVEAHAITTGPGIDSDGYLFFAESDTTNRTRVPPNGAGVLPGLPPGPQRIRIGDVAPHCRSVTTTPIEIHVQSGDTTALSFGVHCDPLPGLLRISAPTSGEFQDHRYWYVVLGAPTDTLAANGTAQLAVPPGEYDVLLADVAINCRTTTPNPARAVVGSADTVGVIIRVHCEAPAHLVVAATATGVDVDEEYQVLLDGIVRGRLVPGDSLRFGVSVGSHTVGLMEVAPNCAIGGSNPRLLQVSAGTETRVDFPIDCIALARLRVTVTTTGLAQPATFTVYSDLDCSYAYYYYGCVWEYALPVPSTGTAELALTPGTRSVFLSGLPSGCTVAAPNPRNVTMPATGYVDISFSVSC